MMQPIARLLTLVFSCLLSLQAVAAPPNILYFYVDDMGWGSIGPNGQNQREQEGLPFVRTPNLNRLAREGVNFTRGYGCHVCSPARSSQQSGFHQGHTFADRNDPDNAKKAMRADDVLMGDALLAAGYTTGYWGKWGYGGSKSLQSPVIENVQTLPTSHGYQHVLAELHHVRAHTFFQPTLWRAPASANAIGGIELSPNSVAPYRSPNYPATPAHQSHAGYPATAYCDDAYCFAALDFVRQQATRYNETGKPFFGLLAAQIPHAPFDEITQLPEWDAAYVSDNWFKELSPQSQQWAAMVTRIDAHFENILNALEDPNGDGDKSDSVAANTLVVFQSDNGGPGGACLSELDSNGGLRGTKGSIWEGGIRVPLIMRWPKHINQQSKLRAGTNSSQVVDVTDLLPTFCDVAEVQPPLGIDGVSIAPTLTAVGEQQLRPFIVHEATGQSIIAGKYKLVSTGGQRNKPLRFELYDLETDAAEAKDIAAQEPALVKELSEHLAAEHVYEPRGFAATYHSWIGNHGGSITSADNWSDYIYENAGVTYISDDGLPRSNWVAKMDGHGTAIMTEDCQFLALQIAGQDGEILNLAIAQGTTLTARNGVRIRSRGFLTLNHSTIATQRTTHVGSGGTLFGDGEIKGGVVNDGTIKPNTHISIVGTYQQSGQGSLTLQLRPDSSKHPIDISNKALLSGTLTIDVTRIDTTVPGPWPILSASKVAGTFSDVQIFPEPQSTAFKLSYYPEGVQLIRR